MPAARECPKSYEVDEVEGPPDSLNQDDGEPDGIDLSDRIWRDENNDLWLTDFPPPPGFEGYQQEAWGEDGYERQCSPAEVAAIEAGNAADAEAALAEDEADRDDWFALIQGSVAPADEANIDG